MLIEMDKKDCTGCGACYNICPKNAITMQADKEGFKYPVIDKEKCINCNLCEKICPVLNKVNSNTKETPEVLAAYTKNETERNSSSSGGIFYELANLILSNNGIVVGAGYDEKFNVVHKIVYNKENLKELQGSKYVQSDTKNTYQETKEILEKGTEVLYVGTPCQIAGLKLFLQKNYDNLYTCDLICHGVPSPKIWQKYLSEYNGKIQNCYFRNKDDGWNCFSMKIVFENNKFKRFKMTKDDFIRLFLNNYTLRPSCYDCKFSKIPRIADISLGDFWGVEGKYPEFSDDKGISLVLVNSNKGQKLLEDIKDKIIYRENCDLAYAIKCNPCICGSVKEPEKRKEFFNDLDKMKIKQLANKYLTKQSLISRIYGKVKRIINI